VLEDQQSRSTGKWSIGLSWSERSGSSTPHPTKNRESCIGSTGFA
jgi:hypothetical protein